MRRGVITTLASGALLVPALAAAVTDDHAVNSLRTQRARSAIPADLRIAGSLTRGCHLHNRYEYYEARRLHRHFYGRSVVGIHQREGESPRLENSFQDGPRPVKASGANHVVARPKCLEHGRSGRRSRGERRCLLAAFKVGKRFLKLLAIRIRRPRITKSLRIVSAGVAFKNSGQRDGLNYRPRALLRAALKWMNGQSLKLQSSPPVRSMEN